jgi:hypothetical protein
MRTFWEAEQEKWYIPIPHNRQTINSKDRMAAANSGLAQWRVMWIIENSSFHQFLCNVDSIVFRKPPLRQAPKHSIFCF